MVLERLGRFAEAVVEYRFVIDLAPTEMAGYRNLARLLATCPADEIRDGEEAVRLARRCCELTGGEDWRSLDVLAAAYAEHEQFGDAARLASALVGLAPQEERPEYLRRLHLFQAGEKLRLDPSAR